MEDQDLRYKQIEKEAESEKGLAKGRRAFQGFGRSTQLADEVSKVDEVTKQRYDALSQVLFLESLQKNGLDVGKLLGEAYSYLSKLASEASKRRSAISVDLSTVGQKASAKFKTNNLLSKPFSSRTKNIQNKIKLGPNINSGVTTPKRSKALKTVSTKLAKSTSEAKPRSKKLSF